MQDRIKQMAEEAGLCAAIDAVNQAAQDWMPELERFAQIVAEDCAKVVSDASIAAADMYGDNAECLSTGGMAQDAIRARYGIKE